MNPSFRMHCEPIRSLNPMGRTPLCGVYLPNERYVVDHAGPVAFSWERDGELWQACWELQGEAYVTIDEWIKRPDGYSQHFACLEQDAAGVATLRVEWVERRQGRETERTRTDYTWKGCAWVSTRGRVRVAA